MHNTYAQKKSLDSIHTLSAMSFRDYLNNMRRAASDLYPARPPFKGLNTLIMPKKDLYTSVHWGWVSGTGMRC